MGHATDHPPGQPTPASLAPRPNVILAEPATVELCRADYEAGADVRQTMNEQDGRHR